MDNTLTGLSMAVAAATPDLSGQQARLLVAVAQACNAPISLAQGTAVSFAGSSAPDAGSPTRTWTRTSMLADLPALPRGAPV